MAFALKLQYFCKISDNQIVLSLFIHSIFKSDMGHLGTVYRFIEKVISLLNISKVFFTFLYINGLCFTIHVIEFSCHFFINHINL